MVNNLDNQHFNNTNMVQLKIKKIKKKINFNRINKNLRVHNL